MDEQNEGEKTIEDFLGKDIFEVETNVIGRDSEGNTIVEKRQYKYVLVQTFNDGDYETWSAYAIKGNSLEKVLHMGIQGGVATGLEVDIFQDNINLPFVCLELILDRCKERIRKSKEERGI